MVKVLVTGGAGFIGSNFVRYALRTHPDWHVTTLDKLTYCGRLENLHDVVDNPRHTFVLGDIADSAVSAPLVRGSHIVVHFAAETHVDRSLQSAGAFIHTDVFGTFALLEAARQATGLRRFIQISTDEVYGSVPTGASKETDELRPRNPYSASKAGADRLAYSYWATYQVPVVVTRASNNYGPYQFPEKVIPLFITNALEDLDLPLYGDGMNVRDWLHVDDHCSAVDLVIENGRRRRGVQHRRRERGAEHRVDAAHPSADRQAGHADPPRGRPARPRPPLRARHLETAGARLGPAARLRGRALRHGRVVQGQPVVVAADQARGSGVPGLLQGPVCNPFGGVGARRRRPHHT